MKLSTEKNDFIMIDKEIVTAEKRYGWTRESNCCQKGRGNRCHLDRKRNVTEKDEDVDVDNVAHEKSKI